MKYLKNISRIIKILDLRTNIFLSIYLINMLILNVIELFGLGILSLYIGIFTDKTIILKFPMFVQNYLSNISHKEVIYQISFFIIFLFIFKNLFIFFQNWFSLKLKQLILVKNSQYIFKKIMSLDFLEFSELNKSNITYKVYSEISRASTFIFGYVNCFKEIVLIAFLFSSLLLVNFEISILVALISIFLMLVFIFLIKDKLKKIAIRINKHSSSMLLSINEIINNYILLNLTDKFDFFLKKFINELNLLIKNRLHKNILQIIPRIFLEVFAVLIIVFLCLLIFNLELNFEEYIPSLTFAALVIIRLIPSLTNMNSNVNEILFTEDSFENFFKNKYESTSEEITVEEKKITDFNRLPLELKLENISFKYNNSNFIFKNLNNVFSENSLIGITGKSGSGKSTFLKLLMGFLKPLEGNILVNNENISAFTKQWRKQIGYMPQQIILINSFIKNNIAMGETEADISEEKISSIINDEYFRRIINYKNFENTKILEDGGNLSGGQIQTIGLARAIYNDKKVIILDEPTNNLDFESKKLFMKLFKIIKKDKIILIVSHDRDLLNMCDKSYILKENNLNEFNLKT